MATIPPVITPPPATPQRGNRSTFSNLFDAFILWLVAFVTEIGLLAANVYSNATAAFNSASAAGNSESAASASEAVAVASAAAAVASVAGSPNATGTSVTLTAVGTGAKTIAIQAGKNIPVGAFMQMARTSAAATTWMNGPVTAYNDVTGSLTIESTMSKGTGSHSDWTVSISAPTNPFGLGGASAPDSVVLTSLSSAAQSLTASKYGQSVQLPDATTCVKAALLFTIAERSDYPRKVINSAGVLLGFIAGGITVEVGLADNGTAAGVWNIAGMVPIAVTAELGSFSLTSVGAKLTRISLDANRTMLICGANSNGNIYGVVYDASTLTWGAPTLLRATGSFYQAILSAANQVLLISCDTTTGLQGVTCTIAGTGITPNAAASVVLAGNITQFADIAVVGAAFVFAYSRATAVQAIRAVTIAGTTVTIGAEQALSGTSNSSVMRLFAVSAAVVLTFSVTNSTNIFAKPFSIAGNVLTPGTEVSFATDMADFRAMVMGARWAVVYSASTTLRCAVVSVAGTVATATTVASSPGIGTSSNIQTFTESLVVGGKVLVGSTGNSSTLSFAMFSDAAGTATTGTSYSTALSSNPGMGPSTVVVSGTSITFAIPTSSYFYRLTVDASGASPVLSGYSRGRAPSGATTGGVSSMKGDRSPRLLMSTGRSYGVAAESIMVASPVAAAAISSDRLNWMAQSSDEMVSGAANESWCAGTIGTTGLTFQRMECAA